MRPSSVSSANAPSAAEASARSSSSRRGLRHVGAHHLAAVEADLDPDPFRASHRNDLREDAVDGVGVDEGNFTGRRGRGADARRSARRPVGRELAERRADVLDLVGDVVHAGAALGEEPPDGRVVAERREELDAARRRRGRTPPRRPGPRRSPGARAGRRTAARRSATAASRSATATPRWWIPRGSIGAMLSGGDGAPRLEDPVDEAVVDAPPGRHEPVAVDVLASPARRPGPSGGAMISAICRVSPSTSWPRSGCPRACRGSPRSPGGSSPSRSAARSACPGAPPARIMAAADMPIPKQIVRTSGLTCCIAS